MWQYYQVTGDLDFLNAMGAEMLIQIARFWVSKARFDPARDRYVIDGVVGPDEFQSITGRSARVTADPNGAPPITIECRGKTYVLRAGESVTVG